MKILILNVLIFGFSVFLWICEFLASKSVGYDFALTWAKLAIVVSLSHFIGGLAWFFSGKATKISHRFAALGFSCISIILSLILYVWFVSGI
jgi:hypothetical protein